MSGFTDDGTGFNASPGSADRAARIDQTEAERIVLADLAKHGDSVCCTRTDHHGVKVEGAAQRTGLGHETYSGTRSRLHDPAHAPNHGKSRVIKLTTRHASQNYYCLPSAVAGRDTVPFKGNTGKRPVKPPQSVAHAVARLDKWAARTQGQMFPERIDYDDLDVVTAWIKGQA